MQNATFRISFSLKPDTILTNIFILKAILCFNEFFLINVISGSYL